MHAVVEVWQHKYEELVVEKADLEQQIHQLQVTMAGDIQAAYQKVRLSNSLVVRAMKIVLPVQK